MKQNNAFEIQLQNSILDFIRYFPRKGFAWPVYNSAIWDEKLKCYRKYTRHHRKGVPDICGIWCRKPLFIEVKAPGGTPTPEQIQFLGDATRHGSIAFVAYSLQDAVDMLRASQTSFDRGL